MPALPTTLLWLLVGLAAIWDVSQRRIPNRLVAVGLLAGLAFGAQADGLVGLGLASLGAVIALAILIGPFAMRVLGGGDVKLAMVCGAFLGWRGVLHVILVGTVVHGLIAILTLLSRRLRAQVGQPAGEQRGVPHAVGFAVATVLYTLGYLRFF